jgi:hypothetical protein
LFGALAVALTALIVQNKNVKRLLLPENGRALATIALICAVVGALAWSPSARAQDSPTGVYEAGVQYGSLLPGKKVRGIREIMEGVLVRGSRPLGSGALEAAFFASNGYGDKYKTFVVEYRTVVWDELFPTHASFGLHADAIAPAGRKSRTGVGWQFGGGMRQPLGETGLSLREDFSYRMGGGTSLMVMVGLSYEFSSSGSN